MPSIYDIKPRFQALLRPLTRWLAARGITANQVTLSAAVLSIFTGVVIGYYQPNQRILLLLPAVLMVRMALNAIDGMLAREHGQKSALGAILNELGDVVSDTALYLSLAFVPGVSPGLIVSFVILAIISEMAGVVAIQIGASRRYDGPMGKSDRAFAIGVIAFVLGLGLSPDPWLPWALGGMILLLVYTIFNRCRRALGEQA